MLSFIFGTEYSLTGILRHYWLIFPAALAVSLVITPLCRRAAFALGIVDRPDQKVKTHAQPTAYLGGVGILAGFLTGMGIGLWMLYRGNSHIYTGDEGPEGSFIRYADWILLGAIGTGAIIACLVGLLDDMYDLRPWQKFLGQAAAAGILVFVGIRPNLEQIASIAGLSLPGWLNLLFSTGIVLFFILGATNSLNLLDGLDGLCAGVTAVITLGFLLLALSLATWGYSPVGDPVRLILCLSLVGGVLGFLPHNRHPAKIFMGDAGSILLGFVAGTLMLLLAEIIGRWTLGGIIIFGLPILDTAVAIVRRYLNHKPLFVSDRGHIYDQMMDRGLGLKKTVGWSYLLAAVYAAAGILLAQIRFRYCLAAFVGVVFLSGWIVWKKGFLQIKSDAAAGH